VAGRDWRGSASIGVERLGVAGKARRGVARLGEARLGVAGGASIGMDWYCQDRLEEKRSDPARKGRIGAARYGSLWSRGALQGRTGMARHGPARSDWERLGSDGRGETG
jgi:hypothetical protein